jgi:hypothetical protein
MAPAPTHGNGGDPRHARDDSSDGLQETPPESARDPDRDERTGRSAAAERIQRKAQWVDMQIRQAVERGEFDDLPGAGKPIVGLDRNDPDWWLRSLVEREQLSGLLPPALELRNEDARLHEVLDRESAESRVRELVADFNRRVVDARRQLLGGPPVITPTRDADDEVQAWHDRRLARARARREQLAAERAAEPETAARSEVRSRRRGPRGRRWAWLARLIGGDDRS